MESNKIPTDFTELVAWQKAKILSLDIYKLTESWRDFVLRDQIRRATVSIMNNLAEGYSRRSAKETMRFFDIAVGSCVEVKSMTYLLEGLEIVDIDLVLELRENITEVHKITYGFMKYLQKKMEGN